MQPTLADASVFGVLRSLEGEVSVACWLQHWEFAKILHPGLSVHSELLGKHKDFAQWSNGWVDGRGICVFSLSNRCVSGHGVLSSLSFLPSPVRYRRMEETVNENAVSSRSSLARRMRACAFVCVHACVHTMLVHRTFVSICTSSISCGPNVSRV